MATQYNVNKYLNGINGFGLIFCDTVYTATLVASTDTSVTVPGVTSLGTPTASVYNKFLALFSYTPADDVFVSINAAATLPAGATFGATTSALRPSARTVKAGDVIHMISNGTPNVSIELYAYEE